MDIVDYQAIAFEWHCGQDSSLYQFATTGEPTFDSIDEATEYILNMNIFDPQRDRLQRLCDYLLDRMFGERIQ